MQLDLRDHQRQVLHSLGIYFNSLSEVQFVRALTAKIRELEHGSVEVPDVSSVYATLIGIHNLLMTRANTSTNVEQCT